MILCPKLLRSSRKVLADGVTVVLASLVLLLYSVVCASTQTASGYPAETIRIIVPFGPASGPDFAVRALQAVLQETIKHPVRVENRPGANSIIGTRAVATAAPDGYTLLGASTGFSTIEITTAQPGFDPLNDFAPVSLTARGAGYVLVVSSKSPINTMADLAAAAKKSEIFYGSPGIGNTLHLVAALFAERVGGSFKHVPYPGVADAVLATARGEVGFAFATPPAVSGLLRSGELKAIGYAGSEPLRDMPAVPLVSSFARNFSIAEPWSGILAPAKTPDAVISSSMTRYDARPRSHGIERCSSPAAIRRIRVVRRSSRPF
jgi:tripartite-type tricarboxylate transporter receptor subunit TctC